MSDLAEAFESAVERVLRRVLPELLTDLRPGSAGDGRTHLSIPEAAERASLPDSAIRRAIARRELACCDLGHRTRVVPVEALQRWLEARTVPAAGEVRKLRAAGGRR